MSMGPEVKEINWKQARGALYRWPQVMRKLLPHTVLIGFTLTKHSYAHEHVPADHWSCFECLPPDTARRERFRGRHSTDRHTGSLRFRRSLYDHRSKGLRQIRQPWLADSVRLDALDRWFRHLPRRSHQQQTRPLCGSDPCRDWSLQCVFSLTVAHQMLF